MKNIKPIILCSTAIIAGCQGNQQTDKEKTGTISYKNIVFIISDDHAAGVLGCYGNDIVRTPNLDRLAAQGVRFTNAYVNEPICSASRQSILTGRYPHAAGVTLLSTPFPEEQVTLADHLSKHGYQTGLFGKTHFNNDFHHGFETLIEDDDFSRYIDTIDEPPLHDTVKVMPTWKPFRTPAAEWLNADAATSGHHDEFDKGTFFAKEAIRFIEKNKDKKFLAWVAFREPHSPFNFPVEYQGSYDPENMPLPETSPEDDRWVPEVFKDLTMEERKGIISAYYTSVEYMDKNVGLILDALEENGLNKNTLVVYLGDHGYLLNDHKRFEKHMMWEPAVQTPLIFSNFGKGRVINELTECVDLVPTMLDIIGVDPMPTVQGKSLLPLLEKETEKHRDFVFSEYIPDNKAMIRTEKWKYIFTTGKKDLALGYQTGNGAPGLTHRLYDQVNDPYEKNNLAGLPKYKPLIDSLKKIMLDKFIETHPKADELPDTLSIDQKLVWFCEPVDVGHKGY